ncbi:predicted protein [Lichtheimia corymbifera JMRC:FSU:9682]|uniref:Uncharacterized protein n=1 Tax=Lichtheimia corymbifera JMRC:FSU:9682 TaxID=1263082 RepID=A0A068SGA5_9FUNG|nr:predicted protein [Lichtheimia corymbifera JMRC:FSU:9682]
MHLFPCAPVNTAITIPSAPCVFCKDPLVSPLDAIQKRKSQFQDIRLCYQEQLAPIPNDINNNELGHVLCLVIGNHLYEGGRSNHLYQTLMEHRNLA